MDGEITESGNVLVKVCGIVKEYLSEGGLFFFNYLRGNLIKKETGKQLGPKPPSQSPIFLLSRFLSYTG